MADWSNMKVESAEDRRKKRVARVKAEKSEKDAEEKKRKQKLLVLSVSVIAVFMLVTAVLSYIFLSSGHEEAVVSRTTAKISEHSGSFEIKKKSIGFYDRVDTDTDLAEGDGIRCRESGQGKVVFPDGSYLKIFENSETLIDKCELINLSSPSTSPLNMLFTYLKGQLVICLSKGGSEITVSTPLGTMIPDKSERALFKITDQNIPDSMKSKNPLKIVVQSGVVEFRDKLGLSSFQIKTFQEAYIWDNAGKLQHSDPRDINPAAERF